MFLCYQFLRLQKQLEARDKLWQETDKKGFQILTYLFQPVPTINRKVCLIVNFDSLFQQSWDQGGINIPCSIANWYHMQPWGSLNKILLISKFSNSLFLGK